MGWTAMVMASVAILGCSAASDEVTPPPEPTATPTLAPTATAVPTPTPTPLPTGAEVVSAEVFEAATFELTLIPDDEPPVRFVGASGPAGVELRFALEDFLAFAAVADPAAADDPLVAQASETLGGPWVVRVVDQVVYVQQELLVETAEGEPGDWIVVEDPALVMLLAGRGVLAGGLDHDVVVDLVRSGSATMTDVGEGEVDDAPARVFRTSLDGSVATADGLTGDALSRLVGVGRLHEIDVLAEVWIGADDTLRRLELEIPADGFAPGSGPATLRIDYVPAAPPLIEAPERIVGVAADGS